MKKLWSRYFLKFCLVFLFIFVAIIGYWFFYLQKAHSSFENYYQFRGCVSLVEKNDDYAFCKLSSGETIKLVKQQDKWYLDGDYGF